MNFFVIITVNLNLKAVNFRFNLIHLVITMLPHDLYDSTFKKKLNLIFETKILKIDLLNIYN